MCVIFLVWGFLAFGNGTRGMAQECPSPSIDERHPYNLPYRHGNLDWMRADLSHPLMGTWQLTEVWTARNKLKRDLADLILDETFFNFVEWRLETHPILNRYDGSDFTIFNRAAEKWPDHDSDQFLYPVLKTNDQCHREVKILWNQRLQAKDHKGSYRSGFSFYHGLGWARATEDTYPCNSPKKVKQSLIHFLVENQALMYFDEAGDMIFYHIMPDYPDRRIFAWVFSKVRV